MFGGGLHLPSWAAVAVTLVAGIGGPAAEVAGCPSVAFGGDGTCGGTAGLGPRLAPARVFESSVSPGCREVSMSLWTRRKM